VELSDLDRQVITFQKVFEETQQQKLELLRQQPTENEYVLEDVLEDFDILAQEAEEKLTEALQLQKEHQEEEARKAEEQRKREEEEEEEKRLREEEADRK